MKILDFEYIKNLNIAPSIVYEWCNEAWRIKDACVLPAKQKMWEGNDGRYITMPCVLPELDVSGIKFISRNMKSNTGVPARNSNIILYQRSKMGPLAILDGIWITNMRTGAIAAHSVIEYSTTSLSSLGLMGLGNAARAFMLMLGNLYKKELSVKLYRYKDQAETFKTRFEKDFPQFHFDIVNSVDEICSCDTVVSAVSCAHGEFAQSDTFKKGCLVVPIHGDGFQNCDLCFDKIIIDDHAHCKSYKYYEQFKDKAIEVTELETGRKRGRDNDKQRLIAYCGGIALHDLYCAYKIWQIAKTRADAPTVEMHYPLERFWV